MDETKTVTEDGAEKAVPVAAAQPSTAEVSEIPFAPASASRLKRMAPKTVNHDQGRLDGFVKTINPTKKARFETPRIQVGKRCFIQTGYLTRDDRKVVMQMLDHHPWSPGRFKASRIQDPPLELAVWKSLPWLRSLCWEVDGTLNRVEVSEYAGKGTGYLDWTPRFCKTVFIVCLGNAWDVEFLNQATKDRTHHWVEDGSLIRLEDPERWSLSLSEKNVYRHPRVVNAPVREPSKRTGDFRHIQIRFYFSRYQAPESSGTSPHARSIPWYDADSETRVPGVAGHPEDEHRQA